MEVVDHGYAVPGETQEFVFLGILVMMGVVLLLLVAYFRRRGWL